MKKIFAEKLRLSRLTGLIAVISLLLLITGCSKKGDPGPDGATGPQGAAGAQGPVGPAGAAGSVILSGNGAPAAALGEKGDFYLDKAASNLYGPKKQWCMGNAGCIERRQWCHRHNWRGRRHYTQWYSCSGRRHR